MAKGAKEASRKLATSPETLRNAALEAIAAALEEQAETIIAENAADLIAGRQAGLSEALLDRLTLTEERISGIAKSVREVIALPDPLGRILGDDPPSQWLEDRENLSAGGCDRRHL